jgi:hypothetical protein
MALVPVPTTAKRKHSVSALTEMFEPVHARATETLDRGSRDTVLRNPLALSMPDCVAFADDRLPFAGVFHKAFPVQPTTHENHVIVSTVVPMAGIDLLKLLVALTAQPGLKTALIDCHANDAGLIIPLSSSSPIDTLNRSVMDVLMPSTSLKRKAEAAAAKALGMSIDYLRALRAEVSNVQKLQLQNIVICGCNIGSNPHVLGTLKHFFGCGSIVAPNREIFFGKVEMGRGGATHQQWQQFADAYPNHEQSAEGDFASAYQEVGTTQLQIVTISKKTEASIHWVKSHLGVGKYDGGSFPLELIRAPDHLSFPCDADFHSYWTHI